MAINRPSFWEALKSLNVSPEDLEDQGLQESKIKENNDSSNDDEGGPRHVDHSDHQGPGSNLS